MNTYPGFRSAFKTIIGTRTSLLVILTALSLTILIFTTGSASISQASTIYLPFIASPGPQAPVEWSSIVIDGSVIADVSSPSRYLMTDHAIQIDPAGVVHVAYYRNGLYYATLTAGEAWAISTVDSTANSGKFPSLAFDSAGTPHISYYDASNHLKYARLNGSTWVTVIVDQAADVGQYSSIVVDSSGNPHIAYYDATNKRIKYVSYNGTAWITPVIIETNSCGGYDSISLALTSQGWPRFSYHDNCSNTDNLKFAWWDGFNWSVSSIDNNGDVGDYSSLVLDADDFPRISYMFDSNYGAPPTDDLRYIRWTGTGWTPIQAVDSVGDVGGYTSIAIGTDGFVHIAYFDYLNGNLKYARYTGSSWEVKTIDSSGNVGYYATLTLDSNNLPHIAYYDDTAKDLKYIRRNFLP